MESVMQSFASPLGHLLRTSTTQYETAIDSLLSIKALMVVGTCSILDRGEGCRRIQICDHARCLVFRSMKYSPSLRVPMVVQ
jgi:hypothetical protein